MFKIKFSIFIKTLVIVLGSIPALFSQIKQMEERPPNIVWITSEDNSKHYLELFDNNGIPTPNIESLAKNGLIFDRAFSNAPVCSVARSAIITGCFGPRIGAQYHRKIVTVPMPDSLKMFPTYLRQVGYFTTNNSKEDYNIIKNDGVWDESSKNASWKNRNENQPFFHVFNIGVSHESSMHFTAGDMETTLPETDQTSFKIQPNHPNTELFKYTNALYRDKIREMDRQVGNVINELKTDGRLDDTFIFYFGDHGGVLPGSKGYLYETGLHVPMVVHVPKKYKHLVNSPIGSTVKGFVSFIDLAPTVLQLAGISIPQGMDGKPFLGKEIKNDELNARDETYSYADRFDEKYDMVRAIRKGKYKYIRNYQPFNFDGLMNNYRYKQMAYQEWQAMYNKGELTKIQSAFFESRPPEMLFDIDADPYETKNLANDPTYKTTVSDLRNRLNSWVKGMPDLSFYPEHVLIEKAFENPVAYGTKHKKDIEKYIEIADLGLLSFKDAKKALSTALDSSDPWERYWAIIVCSTFGKQAMSLAPKIKAMANKDTERINRVRAAEFLAILKQLDPSAIMTKALYESDKPSEALLILNAMVLMNSGKFNYNFDIHLDQISKVVSEDSEVMRRLEFLKVQ
ncbi:sulfatase-like hydrolase/transferase [Arenibacter troitsensis]|uniref:Sulfatase n=1 Tax=Arenibacter troitsensis TaxID=188872 RepID=A0A1X7LA33_9FLAO|nr:sulfatase-like hydrolase/transferase [Arenibacter troitsensis]SMG50615.1 Sulfatase [Arenibacter troitsensis]